MPNDNQFLIAFTIALISLAVIIICIIKYIRDKQYIKLEFEVLEEFGFSSWNIVGYFDESVIVRSRQTLNKYDAIMFFREHQNRLERAKKIINLKNEISKKLKNFIKHNKFQKRSQYSKIINKINELLDNAKSYRILVEYISSADNYIDEKEIVLKENDIMRFYEDPTLLMSKSEYNKYIKEQQQRMLIDKQHSFYENVNCIIDYANENKDLLFIKGSVEKLDTLIGQLFDRTVNTIKKIKSHDSPEWEIIENVINKIKNEINKIVSRHKKILDYYESVDFLKIKQTCETLMNSQREFNEYISEKVETISTLFGSKIIRNETINDDECQYIRPYKKSITPFTAELSASVFSSAENNPLEYVIKNFYPNKILYPEQIQNLHLLIEELATLKEAKLILENYKLEYQQYIANVPNYIMEDDESGFYSRLGFANIDENVLVVEYKFSYTSSGGMAKRTFTVPMTEDTIIDLIKRLENKLTITAFTKEQRALMTNKLREHIKNRDNYTCCNCGNSIHHEPNLLLEIDHIIPVSKGGYTVENNLQTLCWKCNREKSNKTTLNDNEQNKTNSMTYN